jgi:RNA polymerase sigma factor (sigma-70 family)
VASFVETRGHAGDEGDFEALYSTYRSEVQRLASYLLRNTADAEDASQTVFVNVLRALRQGARPAEPRAWLMAITRNVCFSRRRAAAARPDEVELDPERVPEANGDDAPSVDDIVGALARMLPNQRTALILRDFRGAPHSEICQLMELSAAGAETLLTRARVSFREEIEAGEQPFECAETKALVEQQLAGMISASERHSLRTHLRHCASCSTLARAVRSSRGKLAGLIFWPTELFSRLAGALSQAPTAVHVAAAVTSTAAVASVAIPVAVMHGPAADHIEGRAAAPALVQPASASASRPASTASAFASAAASHSVASHAGPSVHAGTPGHARTHAHATHAVLAQKHAAAAASAKVAATGSTAPSGAEATDTPRTAAPVVASSPRQVSHPAAATAPAAQPVGAPPRSSSPATRPSSKPTAKAKAKTRPKTKPKVAPRRRSGGRHPTDPADLAPGSQAPAASMPTPANGADNGAGSGFSSGSSSASPDSSTSSSSSSSSTSSSGGSSPGGRSNASNGSSGGGSDPAGPDDHHKKPKH